jgi:hypothetical protein
MAMLFVTGATGYLGSALLELLVREGYGGRQALTPRPPLPTLRKRGSDSTKQALGAGRPRGHGGPQFRGPCGFEVLRSLTVAGTDLWLHVVLGCWWRRKRPRGAATPVGSRHFGGA